MSEEEKTEGEVKNEEGVYFQTDFCYQNVKDKSRRFMIVGNITDINGNHIMVASTRSGKLFRFYAPNQPSKDYVLMTKENFMNATVEKVLVPDINQYDANDDINYNGRIGRIAGADTMVVFKIVFEDGEVPKAITLPPKAFTLIKNFK